MQFSEGSFCDEWGYAWLPEVNKNGTTVIMSTHNADMVDMFRTGIEPRSHDSILHSMAVLEALDKSVRTDKWEKVKV